MSPIVIGNEGPDPGSFSGIFCPKAVRARVADFTRVDSCGTPMTGGTDRARFEGFVSITATPDIEEGEEIIVKAAGGGICIHDKDCDRIKGFDVEVKLCGFVFPVLEMTVGARALLGTGETPPIIGGTIQTPEAVDCRAGVAIEVWAPNSGNVPCVEDTFPYVLFGYPLVDNWVLSEPIAHANAAVDVTIRGYLRRNANFGSGPSNEWQGAELLATDWFGWIGKSDIPTNTEECDYVETLVLP